MEHEGKYIYCIIGTQQDRDFGPIGIGGRSDKVSTIGADDLAMVISSHPLTKLVVNRENILAHEKVIEEVMKEYAVLPVRFCTIASSADEIRSLLFKRYREFKNLLRDMDHKVELGVKGLWKDMDNIFKEIAEENKEIKKIKRRIERDPEQKDIQAKIGLGKLVEAALKNKKNGEAEKIVDALKVSAFDYKLNNTTGDEMFINASFLVSKGREKEFDNIMEELSETHKDSMKFLYVGPLPPYNFVNVTIYQEEWEK
ncbi:MAG: gas vesicle synthesis GvpLGvpF [Syntrophus sp. (in: bacteria)]|nr:gas vesicle synthesis GvpLGvpF [Syntrophus sp. (in: bacteria)]MBA4418905.1 gas vesicle synthesis GvpLGvpF [Syntrophus sp. (in: bacteria)]